MKLRVVDLPILYSVTYIPPGKRNQVTDIVRSWAPFEVPEVTSVEAPVATVWTQANSYQRYAKDEASAERFFPNGVPVVETRVFEGRPYYRANDGGFGLAEFVEDMRKETLNRYASYEIPRLPGVGRFRNYGDEKNPRNYRAEASLFRSVSANASRGRAVRKLSDDLDSMRGATADAWRKGILVVDGELWTSTRGSEPHYEVGRDGDDTVRILVTMSDNLGYGSVPFRADARAEAIACGMAMAERTGRTFEPTDDVLVATDPSLLTWDPATKLAEQVVHNVGMNITNRASFETWTADMEAAYARLRAAHDNRVTDDASAAEALDSYRGFRDAITPELAADPRSYASLALEPGACAFHHWESVARHRRPDLDMRMDDDAELAMGF